MTDITDTLARLNALHARMIDGQRSTITEQQSFFDEWPAIAAHIAAQAQRIADLEARAVAAEAAVQRQASAVRALRASEETEINMLRRRERQWHEAVTSLDGEREINARLTDEIEQLTAERDAVRAERAQIVAWLQVQGSLLVRDQRVAYSAAADAIEAGAHKAT
jgi:hypothetical protein